MKKIYLSAIALLASSMLSAQAFWTATSYKGAFPITDATPATDWTDGWCNWDPENTVYPATTTTVSSDVTSNTTWSGVVCLVNKVYVKNNAVLTIQPGTIIRGDKTSQGTLIITKGASINAAGTKTAPIIFTSNEAVGNRAEGDWGGVILLGKAINNQPGGIANIEGLTVSTDTEHGGTNDNDNSGTLTYCRIEFSGIPLQPNKEINGLTMGSVGRATTIHHVQVSFNGDDAFEWFGGTVDAKYLVSYRNLDDDFDTDFGFRGRIQFAVAIRDKDLSDAAGDSNCFESDNDGTGSYAQPLTAPKFSNVTIIGPKGDGTTVLPVGEKFEKAFRLRRNTATSCYNSIITGWEKGLSIEATVTEDNFTGDTARFESNLLVDFNAATNVITAPMAFYTPWFGARGNDSTKTKAQVNWVNAFPALGVKPDLRLNAASTASAGATFTSSAFTGGFVNLANFTKEQFTTVTLYPNPTNNASTLFINSNSNEALNVTIEVMDISGKVVLTPAVNQSVNFGYNNFEINTQNLQSGIYFVTINNGIGKETVKLIVNH
ncbi:MAG: T9SS type A sorting domain-containing protein [Bacteroidia bacterium]|nr:T9SS type A sorting domain-containing protein [Bacteroidia bacterium]